jgi:hypothetical protein
MVLPRSSDLKRRTRKSDCALGESDRGGDWPLDQRRSSSPQCADFAHCIGEIAESAKFLGSFWRSVQKLHRHTFSSAK